MRPGYYKNDLSKNENWLFKIKSIITERKSETEELESKVRKCHRK